jgi:hypothetical protein
MSTTYEVEIVFVEEFRDYISSKGVRDSSVILTPSHDIFVRIRPKKVTKETLIGDIGRSLNSSNLFHGMQVRTESSMTTEDLFINNGSHRQTIETVCESFP